MPNWLIWLMVVWTFALVFGAVLIILALWFPADEGNRPAPPEVLANRDAARLDALERIAARHRGSV